MQRAALIGSRFSAGSAPAGDFRHWSDSEAAVLRDRVLQHLTAANHDTGVIA
jgi:hypothetical protein